MNTRTHARSLTAVTLATMALVACSSTSPDTNEAESTGGSYPVTVSSCGADYTYTQPPAKALLGAPGIIETLDALGVADTAIGYTLADYQIERIDQFPNLTQTTTDWTPSREFLISTQPDFFLSNDEQQLLGQGAASKDDLAGIPANFYVLGDYCTSAPAKSTIDVVYHDIENLGTIYGIPDTAAELVANLKERVAAAKALNPDNEQLTAVATTIFDDKVYALSGTYYAAVLDALGLENYFANLDTNFSEISTEQVLAANPDIIFVTHTGPDTKITAINQAEELFATSSAVQNQRVYGIDDTDFQSVGVKIIDIIEYSAQNAFSD